LNTISSSPGGLTTSGRRPVISISSLACSTRESRKACIELWRACVAGTDGALVEIDDLPVGIDGVLGRIDGVLGRIDDVLDEIDGDGVFAAADSVAPN
jgi:hypothetical protein